MKENRIVFVDYLRMVACFLVMLVHASENFYAADASGLAGNVSMLANEQNRFWVAFYDGTLGRISVPLFMLASAFLLVPLKPGVSILKTPIQARAATYDCIYAPLYLPTLTLGTDDVGAVVDGLYDAAIHLSVNGRTSVVHVPAHLTLSHHACCLAVVGKGISTR